MAECVNTPQLGARGAEARAAEPKDPGLKPQSCTLFYSEAVYGLCSEKFLRGRTDRVD